MTSNIREGRSRNKNQVLISYLFTRRCLFIWEYTPKINVKIVSKKNRYKELMSQYKCLLSLFFSPRKLQTMFIRRCFEYIVFVFLLFPHSFLLVWFRYNVVRSLSSLFTIWTPWSFAPFYSAHRLSYSHLRRTRVYTSRNTEPWS